MVDTTGAGDSFIGTLAFSLARSNASKNDNEKIEQIEKSLRAANGVAGWSVQRYGTQPSFAHFDDVSKYFA